MTIEQKLIAMMVERGLFEDQAREIMERVKADKISEPMGQRWHDDIEDYPSPLLAVVWINTKRHALEWIDENLPQAWYRPIFAPAEESAE